jgi:hypothetical protein
MSTAAILSLMLSIFKAIPVLDKWFEELVAAYVLQRKIWTRKENHQAIKKAFETQNQRGLEHEDYSGKPSGIGTIRDSLPGVRK